MGQPSFGTFGSFGPAGPGFGSIGNVPAGTVPTGGSFPTAPPMPSNAMFSAGPGGAQAPQGSPQGLGNMVGQSLGNLTGVQVGQIPQAPPAGGFQAFRAPTPMPQAPTAAAPTAAPTSASALNYGDPIPTGPNGVKSLANFGGGSIPQYLTVGGGQYSGLNQNQAGNQSGSNAPTYQIPNPGYQQAFDAYQKQQQQQSPTPSSSPSPTSSLFGLGGV